jgi:hypothetical protein
VSDTNDINELLALFERLSRSTSGSLFARRYNALTALLAERDALAAEVAALKAKADPLAEMWRELEEYQPMADANGHGESWARMCRERTEAAAEIAQDNARVALISSGLTEPWVAAMSARWAVRWRHDSEQNTQQAIAAIRRAKEGR